MPLHTLLGLATITLAVALADAGLLSDCPSDSTDSSTGRTILIGGFPLFSVILTVSFQLFLLFGGILLIPILAVVAPAVVFG